MAYESVGVDGRMEEIAAGAQEKVEAQAALSGCFED